MEITILSQLLLFSQANYNLEVWNWTSQAWTQRIRAMWFYHFLVEKWNWMDFSYIFISIGFGALKNSIQFLLCLFWLLLYLGTRASGWWTVAAVMGTPSTGRQNCNWLNSELWAAEEHCTYLKPPNTLTSKNWDGDVCYEWMGFSGWECHLRPTIFI